MPYRNVIVGTDGSETATRAVEHAAKLAAAFGSRLTVVTAYTADPSRKRAADEAPEDLRWMVTDSAAASDRAAEGIKRARELGVTDVHHRTAEGDPASIVVQAAEETGGDLIVVGSRGMTSTTRSFSVPNKVSHHAPCDVLIVQTGP